MKLLYNIAIYSYLVMIRLGSLFNKKAARWIRGRKNWRAKLRNQINNTRNYAWFHCASLGEFEQGRPVIEAFKKSFPDLRIILTFFSPSGFEVRKNYEGVEVISYLPIDTPKNARQFIAIVNPRIAIFVKYEFWFNYLNTLHGHNIPVFVISAVFRKEQHFFKNYGWWFRNHLRQLDGIFVQNETSARLLREAGINNMEISGDTRFDRVAAIAKNPEQHPIIAEFAKESKVLLGGSTWPPGEKLLQALLQSNIPHLKLIIAPHEIHEDHLKAIESLFPKNITVRLSNASEQSIKSARVLIIDGMGFLSSLYQYCEVAYIGGGFGKGIHNILEAVTFGKPVIIGPNYSKFNEARELVEKGGAFAIENSQDFISISTSLLTREKEHQAASGICREYMSTKTGATGIIITSIEKALKA